jgi:hypothetical protein
LIAAVIATTPDTKNRYSACFADRGYNETDALLAANVLWQNNTFAGGLNLTKQGCIYNHVNTTVVSMCNGSGRNRTVQQDEVRRGISQLIKDCGGDGDGFSGYHVVNNLTFAAYGVFGGKNVKLPPGSSPPDLPGGVRLGTATRASRDPCETLSFNGQSRFDCPKKEGHTINPDTGVCGTPSPYENKCQTYCEVRRTGFYGLETFPDGQAGQNNGPSLKVALAQNTEYSVTHAVSVGVEGVIADVFGLGVGYEYSVTTTKGRSIEISIDTNGKDNWRWVYFPKMIETCGDVSTQEYIPESSCTGSWCEGTSPEPPRCEGEIKTTHNICSLTPYILDGQPIVYWTIRYEDEDENVLPLKDQFPDYQKLCQESGGDPDGDNEYECAVTS